VAKVEVAALLVKAAEAAVAEKVAVAA